MYVVTNYLNMGENAQAIKLNNILSNTSNK